MSARPPVEQAEAQRRSLTADYAITFGTEAGQRVLEDLRRSAGYYRTEPLTDREGRIDPYRTVLNEGPLYFVRKIERHIRDYYAGVPEVAQTYAASTTATQEP
jgi:hypothetical protein